MFWVVRNHKGFPKIFICENTIICLFSFQQYLVANHETLLEVNNVAIRTPMYSFFEELSTGLQHMSCNLYLIYMLNMIYIYIYAYIYIYIYILFISNFSNYKPFPKLFNSSIFYYTKYSNEAILYNLQVSVQYWASSGMPFFPVFVKLLQFFQHTQMTNSRQRHNIRRPEALRLCQTL